MFWCSSVGQDYSNLHFAFFCVQEREYMHLPYLSRLAKVETHPGHNEEAGLAEIPGMMS
jgi:hypothetical protein